MMVSRACALSVLLVLIFAPTGSFTSLRRSASDENSGDVEVSESAVPDCDVIYQTTLDDIELVGVFTPIPDILDPMSCRQMCNQVSAPYPPCVAFAFVADAECRLYKQVVSATFNTDSSNSSSALSVDVAFLRGCVASNGAFVPGALPEEEVDQNDGGNHEMFSPDENHSQMHGKQGPVLESKTRAHSERSSDILMPGFLVAIAIVLVGASFLGVAITVRYYKSRRNSVPRFILESPIDPLPVVSKEVPEVYAVDSNHSDESYHHEGYDDLEDMGDEEEGLLPSPTKNSESH